MNGNTMRACCTQPLRFLTAITAVLLLFAACDDPSEESDTPVIPVLAMPGEADIAYGPVNDANPFEHVGLRHNECVHAVIRAAQPWDTLSMPTMFSRIQKSIPDWGAASLDVPRDRGMMHVQTAFAMKIDSAARHQLSAFDAAGYSAREIGFLRRIGRTLCTVTTFPSLEAELLVIEKDILSETWPAGDSTETAARIAISVAKHSGAYWKRMFCVTAGVDPGAMMKTASLRKSTDLLIHLTTKAQIVTAADVIAAVSAGEASAIFGPLAQLQAAILSGGAVSIIVATLVYFEDIVGFLRSVCPWGDRK
ncbi:MAG: hypothetical protein IH600_05325 [Bacteroidetes bacterium]|nr:hypothetical protein [Bacteroidota bacterium]